MPDYFTYLFHFMNIRTRLIFAFSILASLIVLPNLILLNNMMRNEKSLTDLTISLEAANVRLTGLMVSFAEMREEAGKMRLSVVNKGNDKTLPVSTNHFFDANAKVKQDIQFLSAISEKHKNFSDKLETNRAKLCEVYIEMNGYAVNHNAPEDFAKTNKLIGLQDSTNSICKNTLSFLNGIVFEQDNRAKETAMKTKNALIILAILGILIALIGTFFTLKSLMTPLNTMIAATKKIGKGDYSFRLKANQNDEFGLLSTSFNQMLDDLNHGKLLENQKKELETLNTSLRVKNDSLDSFVYRVSHDLKAPIINITSLLGLVKKRVPIEDKFLGQTFGYIDDSIKRLQTTIYDLLEVSRIERNLNAEKEEQDIYEVLVGIKEQFREMIRKEEAEILTDFRDGGALVFFSEANLKSILSNIISNAIKYRSPDRKPVISLTTVMEGDYLKLTIEDNGIGFDMKRHGDNLFKMFARFHSHVEGSGVGLYIVHKLIIDNGGKIVVKSEVSKGTIFNLYFKMNPEPFYV
jgi:signal transduction histidine kinase